MATKTSKTFKTEGVRVAVEGCGHGTLDAIYASVATACKERGWDGVDLLIIGGDFQAVRNAADLAVMAVPSKYRQLGDFPAYYSGKKTAPYLTIFVAGNHEASAHLWELYYGGWVAPNIYYLGAANVLRFGPLRIAGMGGIWKGFDYRKPHHERLPFSRDDVRSFYHVREVDVRKLLLLREQVDVGLSHDWPRAIENHGNSNRLWKMKPDFRKESIEGTLGNPAAAYVMDRLRPAYWFSAHLHCKFTAIKTYQPPHADPTQAGVQETPALPSEHEKATGNPDEIDLDDEDDGDVPSAEQATGNLDKIALDDENDGNVTSTEQATRDPAKINLDDENDRDVTSTEQATGNPDEVALDDEDDDGDVPSTEHPVPSAPQPPPSEVTEELRAQLPASFAPPQPRPTPGQPVPPSITNTTTRFLALDKCLPGRKFMQLCALEPVDPTHLRKYRPSRSRDRARGGAAAAAARRYTLSYDAEWLAITRVFAAHLAIGDPAAAVPADLGEAAYRPLVEAERAWVDEHVVRAGRLAVPENFAVTAPPHEPGQPEVVQHQPDEYTNPQTAAFCELLGVPNLWDASAEERDERKARGPPACEGGDHGGGGGGGGRGRGSRGGSRGRGRGGRRGGGRGGRH
ncbi:lariat debranching enzyme, C-terminal domain-containing protein [Ustulina deusta]|nr:lariat debranching enzyme, C-terminal domain-containing protein [Ustulina deusta]